MLQSTQFPDKALFACLGKAEERGFCKTVIDLSISTLGKVRTRRLNCFTDFAKLVFLISESLV